MTLRITWNGGDPIEIPSGFAAEEKQRVYYPLEELAEMDFTLQANTPADAPSVQGPAGTGSGTGTAVQPGDSSAADPEDTGSVPEAAEPDAESSDPDEPAEPAGPADSGEEQSGTGSLLPAGLALVAVLAVILLWRRRRDNEQK